MDLTNDTIRTLCFALNDVAQQPMRGRLKFKIAKNQRHLLDAMGIAESVLDMNPDGTYDPRIQNNKEVLEQCQDVDIEPLTEEELEDIELTPATVMNLLPILGGNK